MSFSTLTATAERSQDLKLADQTHCVEKEKERRGSRKEANKWRQSGVGADSVTEKKNWKIDNAQEIGQKAGIFPLFSVQRAPQRAYVYSILDKD